MLVALYLLIEAAGTHAVERGEVRIKQNLATTDEEDAGFNSFNGHKGSGLRHLVHSLWVVVMGMIFY